MSSSLTRKTFVGFIWQFGGTVFKSALQLAVIVVLARLISKEDFGIVQSALVVVGLAKLVSHMGVGPALVQRDGLTEKHIRSGATITFILSLILFIIVFFSSGLISHFFRMPELQEVLKVVAFIFILEGITTVSQSLLLREMKQKILVKIDFISYLVGYGVVAMLLAYLGWGLWALIMAQITQSFIKCVLSYIKSKHSILPYWGKQEVKELLYYGGGFTLARFFNFLAGQGDNIIAGRYLGADLLGVYSRAYAIMVKPVSLIGDSIDKVLFPAMAARQNDPRKLIEAFINGSKMITFLCIPISVSIVFTSPEIINVMLGSGWEEAIIPLQVLTAALVFRIGYKMGDILSRATGNVYSRARRQLVYAICMLLGSYFGSFWGINGLAFGTIFAIIINYVLMIHLSLVILDIKWIYFLRRTLVELPITILLSLIFIVIYYSVKTLVDFDLLILILSFGLTGVISLILFYYYSYKLSFLNIIPFKGTLKKITKQK